MGPAAADALADPHLIASDKLVFNNQFTYVDGGFFLDYQDVPTQVRRQSRYTGSADGRLVRPRARPAACGTPSR